MPTAKGKGGAASHRYRPAAEYDNATLAQKREYWRTKKREQRARLSESRGDKLVGPNVSGSFAAFSSPLLSRDESGDTAEEGSVRASERQKEKWLQTMELNKVLPQVPASYSVRAAGIKAVTSALNAAPRLNAPSSVPPPTASRIPNGSSAKTPPPCVSMQGAFSPKSTAKAQPRMQPKLSPCSATAGRTFTPHRGATSALAPAQRPRGVCISKLTSTESEEERAAKRREHWRIKKREQRAKMAAQLAKSRERIQETTSPRHAGRTGQVGGAALACVSSRTFSRRVGQNPCHARVTASFTPAKSVAAVNLQADQLKVHHPPGSVTGNAPEVVSARKAGETQRKLPLFVSVSRGVARCKTPRQRFIDAQKTFMNQRNIRCKSPMLASFFGARNIPKIDPNDTPEQIIAKRRENWRIKKREQRAKLSMEMKSRLKERDCVTRRVKRYQKILEEMRRARAQSAGSMVSHASETIGGFIKEDGTVSISIPTNHGSAEAHNHSPPISTPHIHPDNQGRVVAPPHLRPAQVNVSFPLARLPSIKPRAESTGAPPLAAGQLKLTLPQTPESASSGASAAASSLGGCVMKMAVSSSVASPSASCPEPELSEEERMAKKREYWRIKKREQRAARAARLKQGLLQARALQRRKIQRQVSPLPAQSAQPPHPVSGIKQEAAVDLDSPAEQAICPDPKPPAPPSPPQQESDPATTLLAVASMKKLLEESLSSVSECKSVQADVKMEDEASDPETKPGLMQLFFEEAQAAPLAADLTLEIKSWQADSDASVQTGSPSLPLKNSPQTSRTPSPLPVSSPTCETLTQTFSNVIVKSSTDASEGPSSPRRTPRICTRKTESTSAEPPRLHHLPLAPSRGEPSGSSEAPSPQKSGCMVTAHGGLSSLQRKREYWKLMKRQQRARLKARQRDSNLRSSHRNTQASGVKGVSPPVNPAPQSRPPMSSVTSVTSVTCIPTVLVVSPAAPPAAPPAERPPGTLQVKVPVHRASCSEQRPLGPSQAGSDSEDQRPSATRSGKWICRSTDVDSPPPLPTLKPPENPLTTINLHPIEPPPQTLSPTLIPIKTPSAHHQTPTHMIHKLSPISTMVPPKRVPGESEEDFLRRKREYWRIKKKEQRARKAIREKGVPSRGCSKTWRPILPAHELHTQDSGPWVNSSEESEHLMSQSDDGDPSSFSYPSYTAPLEDESELGFLDFEAGGAEDGPVPDAVWRNRYLMDFDPLNQLLVCMVCGEQQYSQSLEGVRAHIEDAHPDTLNLEPGEHHRILEAWDEQVSRRERFFTSQLQRNSETET